MDKNLALALARNNVLTLQRLAVDRGLLTPDMTIDDQIIDGMDMNDLRSLRNMLHEVLYAPPQR